MILYEVYLEIAPEVFKEYLQWLPDHVDRVAALPGFQEAVILADEDRDCVIKVVYTLDSKESLENYFKYHADEMRRETQEKFAGCFKAERRVFKVLENASGNY